ncbi:MAG: hypothetical protein A3B37_03520 [Candidatus Sungbacteria bacterium RIFCSPLOWO2_01_FULL_59_16]|uniref:Uncharacterized protein n=1 Tax=Candidatus Sungbacteria bacterium RIFCSPLOWO2_01_FULL_59_16 TaxID=1802280 RepID=A0A1G2LCI6_9BACT|nr:MAG: hypothetical protein A3B37_03520 [Candidatus Sungbacteria bacterium RIFCSPLOWO2_01_FULL_59_16]
MKGVRAVICGSRRRSRRSKFRQNRFIRKLMVRRKEHLTDAGFRRIRELRNEYRKYGKKRLKTARVRENRSPGGARQ